MSAPALTLERRISPRQLMYLLVAVTAPTETLYVPRALFSTAGKDVVWAVMLATLATYPVMLVAVYALTSGEPMDFPKRARSVLGGSFGTALAALFALALAVKMWPIWGGLEYLLATALLPHTPIFVLALMSWALCAYVVTGGIEVAGRLAAVLVPLTVFAICVLFAMSTRWFHPSFLYPIAPTQLGPVVHAAAISFSLLIEVVMVAYLGAFVDDPTKVRRSASIALCVNGVVLMIVLLQTLLVFGPLRAVGLNVPALTMARTIHYGFIIERLDVIVTPHWTALIILKLTVWAIVVGDLLRRSMGGLTAKSYSWLVLGATAGLSLLTMHNLAEIEGILTQAWMHLGAWVVVGCVATLALATAISRLRATKKSAHA